MSSNLPKPLSPFSPKPVPSDLCPNIRINHSLVSFFFLFRASCTADHRITPDRRACASGRGRRREIRRSISLFLSPSLSLSFSLPIFFFPFFSFSFSLSPPFPPCRAPHAAEQLAARHRPLPALAPRARSAPADPTRGTRVPAAHALAYCRLRVPRPSSHATHQTRHAARSPPTRPVDVPYAHRPERITRSTRTRRSPCRPSIRASPPSSCARLAESPPAPPYTHCSLTAPPPRRAATSTAAAGPLLHMHVDTLGPHAAPRRPSRLQRH